MLCEVEKLDMKNCNYDNNYYVNYNVLYNVFLFDTGCRLWRSDVEDALMSHRTKWNSDAISWIVSLL